VRPKGDTGPDPLHDLCYQCKNRRICGFQYEAEGCPDLQRRVDAAVAKACGREGANTFLAFPRGQCLHVAWGLGGVLEEVAVVRDDWWGLQDER
jgi:hypothetical protein